jgi:hypothetical protein
MIPDREKRDRLHDLWKIQFNGLNDPDKVYNYWRYVGQLGVNDLLDDDLFVEIGFLGAARKHLQNVRQQDNEPVENLYPELVEYLQGFEGITLEAGESETSGGLSTN